MADTTDVSRLQLETNAEAFAKEIAKSENALERLQTQLKLSPGNFDALDAAMDEEVDKLEVLRRKLAETEAAMAAMDAAGTPAVNKLKGLGQAGLQTGRIIQDFAQGGFAGIINNIEGFARAVGGGAGLAGVLTVLGTAFLVLKPLIAGFLESMNAQKPKEFADAITVLQARIKELQDNPVKMAVDMRELDVAKDKLQQLQKAQQAFDALGKGRSEFEKASGDQVKQILDTMPMAQSQKLQAELTRNMLNELRAKDPTIQGVAKAESQAEEEIRKAEARMASATSQGAQMQAIEAIKDAKKRLEEAREASKKQNEILKTEAGLKIGEMSDGASRGNALDQQRFAARVAGAGRADIAAQIRASSPQAMQAKKMREDAAKAMAEAQKEQDKADKERANRDRIRADNGGVMPLDPDMARRIREAEAADKAETDRRATIVRQQQAMESQYGSEAEAEAARKGAPKAAAARRQEDLARQIYNRSAQMTGVQFTPDQSREAAKAATDLAGKNVNLNAAVQSAMLEQLQAMEALANRLIQQQAQMRQIANGFGQVNRFMQAPGPTNLNFGTP